MEFAAGSRGMVWDRFSLYKVDKKIGAIFVNNYSR
jgi:hypothetical protein